MRMEKAEVFFRNMHMTLMNIYLYFCKFGLGEASVLRDFYY